MAAPDSIRELVERFHMHRDAYKASSYNETQVRREFIDPMFIALGWDVDNRQGYAEQYKDVVHEDAIKIGGATKAPDYCFRIGGVRKFFLEAKRPAVNLKEDPEPAYQLRRYAWTAQMPLSILTDFEEFIVFDTRVQPKPTDKASTARIMYLSYTDYIDRWDDIAAVFSREAILKGAFDKYADSTAKKRGTAEVDDAFLAEIERWRDALARNMARRNPNLTQRQLNTAVQSTIDRIIFLRLCEDRGIEDYGELLKCSKEKGIYDALKQRFVQADYRYNSGLFHFDEERGRPEPDRLALELVIDDKTLRPILRGLYYPDSPYEFSVLPADILGQVYERFLGSVIRLTRGHQAKVEEKPEVRKAGGVYYTPTYIVDYIVRHTVGTLLESKKPGPRGSASDLRILDPACGSGSFLIGAYQYLLDWHLEQYLKNPARWAKGKTPALYQHDTLGWRLTTAERKRILLDTIYGVDIDPQAVEVTKLSLLLKVLEGENAETLKSQRDLFQERALPDLANNIKCGNSLIGPDFYHGQQLDAFDEEDYYRINAFDWHAEFPAVFNRDAPGFDAVIGNPPYVRQEGLGPFKDYFAKHYQVYAGTADLYAYFIERGVSLLRNDGLFSYIVANKWMRANYGEPLRRWLTRQHIEEIVDFGDLPVFRGATTYPCILRIRNAPPTHTFRAATLDSLAFTDLETHVDQKAHPASQQHLAPQQAWTLVDDRSRALLEKIRNTGIPLGEYVNGKIYYGIKTGLNKAFVIDEATRQELIAQDPNSADLIKPFLAGRDIKRYCTPKSGRYIILIPNGWTRQQTTKNHWAWMQQNYPAIAAHLAEFAAPAQKRWDKGEFWWELRTCDYYFAFERPKIIVPAITQSASYMFDTEGYYSNDKTTIVGTGDLYLLGTLNSKVPDYLMHTISSTKRGAYYEYKPMYLVQLPIPVMDLQDKAQGMRHDRIVSLVEHLLDLHKRLQDTKTDHERTLLRRQITATDNEIDRLVYELYGLTDNEIALVEASVKR